MQAVVIKDGRVTVGERPTPVPSSGELLVRVEAAGLNGADLMQVAGLYPPPAGVIADIPGMEIAGVVVDAGTGCKRFRPGDRVMSIVGGAGQAELALVSDETAMAVPETVSFAQAGGFPEVFITAYDALCIQAGLQAGERMLVTGAAGGVGLAGVQIGCIMGAEVIASVHRDNLRDRVSAFGAKAIDPAEVPDHGPYDVILELVGATNLATDLQGLAIRGRIVVIGVSAGARTEIDLRQVMARRATLRGSTLRARSIEEKAEICRLVERDVLPALSSGSVRVPIDETYPLGAVQTAYERFAAGGKLGKIVLLPPAGNATAGT